MKKIGRPTLATTGLVIFVLGIIGMLPLLMAVGAGVVIYDALRPRIAKRKQLQEEKLDLLRRQTVAAERAHSERHPA